MKGELGTQKLAQCEQSNAEDDEGDQNDLMVVIVREPGPHGCTVGGGLLLYHPPRPLGPGVLPSHCSLEEHQHKIRLPRNLCFPPPLLPLPALPWHMVMMVIKLVGMR